MYKSNLKENQKLNVLKATKIDTFKDDIALLNRLKPYFTNWDHYFLTTKPIYAHNKIGNFGEIKECNLKVLSEDKKVKVNYFGALLAIDKLCLKK